jgi:hypothetical protein
MTFASAQKPPARSPALPSTAKAAAVAATQPEVGKTASAESRKRQVKIFEVKYASVDALSGMLNDLRQGSSPDRAIPQPGLHAIAIEAYSPEFLRSSEELIRRFDVPAMSVVRNHDFEIVARILVASGGAGAAENLPKDLDAAARKLKETFGYTDIKLADSVIEHSREGRDAFTKGIVSGLSEGATQLSTYEMAHRLVRYEPGATKGSVTLYGFQFKMRLAYLPGGQTAGPAQWQEIAFQTDLNIPEGQSVVVGKSKIGTEDKFLVLVLQVRMTR